MLLFFQRKKKHGGNSRLLARYYPKTSVPMASAEHPQGFTSVRSSFKWPKMFLDKLAKHFGDDWLAKRLSRWRWSVSTAFSGVGAPESVLTPAHPYKSKEIYFNKCYNPFPLSLIDEALTSLEVAAKEFLKGYQGGKMYSRRKNVDFTSTCECDPHCQRVLKKTYGLCNWPDVKTFKAKDMFAFCTTHQQECPVHTALPNRN